MIGDFLGFTFNGVHSSDLGITRVSDGSRYSLNLLPTFQDKTVQIPGGDGAYHYGTYYTQRNFNESIAFDGLTDEQIRRIREVFGDKKIHSLIFDEVPFKVYKAKITGSPNLKYVSFDVPINKDSELDTHVVAGSIYDHPYSGNTKRIYKGEGQLNFVAYSPFATSRYKFLDEYNSASIPEWDSLKSPFEGYEYQNTKDWKEASRMIESYTTKMYNGNTYTVDVPGAAGIMYYNAGDAETPFRLIIKPKSGNVIRKMTVKDLYSGKLISLDKFTLTGQDDSICIDGKLHLIQGLKNGEVTGTIYNKYISAGDFFPLPQTSGLELLNIGILNDSDVAVALSNFDIQIDYKYLYF